MFKVGEIVRVGDDYINYFRNTDDVKNKLKGQFVIIDILQSEDFMGEKKLTFYEIRGIDNNYEYEMGEIWLKLDINWYRRKKIERICSKLEI